jgi:hypothetical protein
MAISMVRSSSQLVLGELLREARAHGLEALEERLDLAEPFLDVAGDVLFRIELRLLRQIPDLGALGRPGLSHEVLIEPAHDAQQRRFTGAVGAEHADLGARQERQPDVLQHLAAAGIGLAEPLHHVDVLIGWHQKLSGGSVGMRAF